jgi:hypothetical protein
MRQSRNGGMEAWCAPSAPYVYLRPWSPQPVDRAAACSPRAGRHWARATGLSSWLRLASFSGYAPARPKEKERSWRSSTDRQFSARSCVTPAATQKTLDGLASTGAEAAAAGARFEITINLGADHIERYSKSIEVNADDTDPNDVDTTDVIAAITMNKSKDSDNGGHL